MNDILFKSILAMDSYNRGYDRAIEVPGMAIGNATIVKDSGSLEKPDGSNKGEAIGFYALAYDTNGDNNGETIISYRGGGGLTRLNPLPPRINHNPRHPRSGHARYRPS